MVCSRRITGFLNSLRGKGRAANICGRRLISCTVYRGAILAYPPILEDEVVRLARARHPRSTEQRRPRISRRQYLPHVAEGPPRVKRPGGATSTH